MIKNGESCDVYIDSYSHEGYGVGRCDGFVIMVPGALRKEICRVRICKLEKNYAVGEIVEVLSRSEKREKPFCRYFSRCGGCDLQHMKASETLDFKRMAVENALFRIGGIHTAGISVLGMDKPLAYRDSVQYHGDGSGAYGFYEKGSNRVVDIKSCPLQSGIANKIYCEVRNFIKDNDILYITDIVIRTSFYFGQAMLILVTDSPEYDKKNGDSIPRLVSGKNGEGKIVEEALISFIKESFPECTSVYLSRHSLSHRNKKTVGDVNRLIYGEPYIKEKLGKYEFSVSPQSFFQVNPLQTKVLYEKVTEFAGLKGEERVFDLYCGTGSISIYLSEKAGTVTGVECVEEAVWDANKNMERNGVKNVRFVQAKAEAYMPGAVRRGEKCDVAVVDPPRAGCGKALLDSLIETAPKRIVYVSCNPATLARDLKALCAGGYEVQKVEAVDMFPWTRHVETVVLLSHKKPDSTISVKVEFGEGEGKSIY